MAVEAAAEAAKAVAGQRMQYFTRVAQRLVDMASRHTAGERRRREALERKVCRHLVDRDDNGGGAVNGQGE